MKKIDNQAALAKMVRKYLAGRANADEIEFLETYFEHFDKNEDLLARFSTDEKVALGQEMTKLIDQRIASHEQPKVRKLGVFIKVAAAVLLMLSISLYFYSVRTIDAPVFAEVSKENDVMPGSNKALLTLANGSKISLDDAKVGELGKQGGVVIRKSKDGELVYDLANNEQVSSVGVNIMETPRGGTYQVLLPDGTKVWLNAASRLTFPTAFNGKDRKVELVGEAYFEVAKNRQKPFLVSSAGQVVEVLGTHFNVSAYAEELTTKTTLLEGSVRVSKIDLSASQLLKPGQQSMFKSGADILVSAVNGSDAIAWKNGYLAFANENIVSVMKKVSRWYDVEVEYSGNITKEGFKGSVSRYENISEVLSALEATGLVHFKLSRGDAAGKGRRVIVMP